MSTFKPATQGATQRVARGDCDLGQELLHRPATVFEIAAPAAHWDSRRYLLAVQDEDDSKVARRRYLLGVRARSRSFLWL
jgi:hypothetical protein